MDDELYFKRRVLMKNTIGTATVPNTACHRAKTWQIGFFALNDVAINFYWMLMTYMAFYLQGVLGLTVAIASFLLAALNIFDGITDPIIGYIMDKTSGRFGKFRPFMVLGNAILALNLFFLYFISYAPAILVLPLIIVCFIIYDIGFTLQSNVTRAAQAVLTNDQKQRPVFAAFSTAFSVILFAGMSLVVSNLLEPRHGGLNLEMFRHFFVIIGIASVMCTILAVIGIRSKDRPEYYGDESAEAKQKIKFRDCIDILRHNRNVLMLIISASTDRLFSHIATNTVVMVMIFGIISGDFALFGQSGMFVALPSLLISLFTIVFYARRYGQKRALLFSTKGAMIANAALFLAFIFLDPATLNFSAWGLFTIILVVGLAFRGGFSTVGSRIIIPMIGDCADDEFFRTGKFVPGIISGLFTFTDKIFGALNAAIVGILLIIAGYAEFPTPDTPLTSSIFVIAMICYIGLPMLGWVINLIALRFYDLTPEKMERIRRGHL